MLLILFVVFVLFIISVSSVMAYFFLKPYMQTKAQRIKVLSLFLILALLSAIFYFITTYLMYTTASFENGVELLQKRQDISNKIGNFKAYTYFERDLPKKEDNPAFFKVALNGSLATIYLSCKVRKDTLGVWRLIEVKEDSLIKVRITK